MLVCIPDEGPYTFANEGEERKKSKVAQSCPTLCNPRDCSAPGSSVHGDSPGKNTGVGCHALLQGIFLSQGLNSGLPHCRRTLYHLSPQGSPPLRYLLLYLLLLSSLNALTRSSRMTQTAMMAGFPALFPTLR